jgi:arginase
MRRVTLVDAPTSAGAYAPGQEDGPRALRDVGLVSLLEAAGVTVNEGGQVDGYRWQPDATCPRAANAGVVVERAGQVARFVRAAGSESTVVVLGGDCTVGVGTVAGLVHRLDRLGVVYVDRHADLNVPESTVDGALDWMGVAHMLDIDGALDALAGLAGRRPMLRPREISFLGLGVQTPFENDIIAASALPVVDVRTIAAEPTKAARDAVSPLASCDGLAVHFDVDLVDFLDAPLAENTDRGLAPSLKACGEALRSLLAEPRVRALTVTEFNPDHGDGTTSRRLAETLVHALSAPAEPR